MIDETMKDSGAICLRLSPRQVHRCAVIGERCTGTNLLRFHAEKNLNLPNVTKEVYGWKHSFPARMAYPDDVLFLVIFREPFSWSKSLYAKPWHASPKMKELDYYNFIRSEWHAWVMPASSFDLEIGDPLLGKDLQYDRHPLTGERFENILKMRSLKNQGFLSMVNRVGNLALIRMESLQENPQQVLSDVAREFDLVLDAEKLQHPSRRLGRYDQRIPAISPAPARLEGEDLAYFRSQLDDEQEAMLGYELN